MTLPNAADTRWCIVMTDDPEVQWTHRPECGLTPIQYQSPDASTPLLQRALRRAITMAPASQVLIAALEEFRGYWEPLAWFVKPAHRMICSHRANLPLGTSAAILSIA